MLLGRGKTLIVGVIVLCVFAAIWGVVGLAASSLHRAIWVLPPLVSTALVVVCSRLPGLAPAGTVEDGRRIGRLVGIWSSVEGLAIGVAVVALRLAGHPDRILPAIAVIVGLHFLPLAHGLPQPAYYAAGAGLIVLGAVAMMLPAPGSNQLAGIGAAVILWSASLAVVLG